MGRGDTRTQVEVTACRNWNIVSGVSTICAQQAAKNWRKAPQGIFDKRNCGFGKNPQFLSFHILQQISDGNTLEEIVDHFIQLVPHGLCLAALRPGTGGSTLTGAGHGA